MKTPPACWLLLLLSLATATDEERIAQGNDEVAGHIGLRNLKKAAKDTDYYYNAAPRKPKESSGSPKVRTNTKPDSRPSSSPKGSSRHTTKDSSTRSSHPSKPHRKKKSEKRKDKLESRSSKNKHAKSESSKRSGKGKEKGSHGDGDGRAGCSSPIADAISDEFSQVITQNPTQCCNYNGPTAVYVTHALEDDGTPSGFEPFWDEMYSAIARLSEKESVCFVMTGVVDLSEISGSSNSLSEVLVEVNHFVSQLPDVVSMISTDPTENIDLLNEIRAISSDVALPSIGVFNAGFNNIIVESIVSGQGRIPYVGYLDDADYGSKAAQISLDLLDGVAAKPLCFNARLGVLDFIGERCAAYYDEITEDIVEPAFGVACSKDSTASDIFDALSAKDDVNAVWAHVDCCSAVADAVEMIRRTERKIVVGCQDEDTSNGKVDFVTKQPIALEANSATSWANFPVVISQQGRDGSGGQYFPGLQSLVNTDIFNAVIF